MTDRQRMLAMSAILITVAMATLDIAVANTALPTIAADLNATAAASVWVVNAYQLAVVATLLPLAALGEIIGPRRVYLAGIAVFSIASLVCALAWSLPSLTLARIAQGAGASGVMSVNAALIRFIYPTNRLGRGIGLNAMVVAISTAIGPTVASGILAVANWPWLFAINLPFGLLAMAVGAKTLPRIISTRDNFDGLGAALSAGLFGLLVIGIGSAAHADPPWQFTLELFGAAICLMLLLRHQRGRARPILPLDLFRRKIFALSSATAFASFGAQGLAFVALPFLFQTVLGHTQVETGLLMTPWPALTACAVPLAGRLADRYSAGLLCGIGLIVLAAGLASLVLLPAAPSSLAIGWRMAVCGAGFGFFQAPNQRALLSSAPPERSGGASGIVALSRLMGQAIGAALVAACFSIAAGGGPTLALALGAGFSAVAAVASFARMAVADTIRG